jgi:hypothetical protein
LVMKVYDAVHHSVHLPLHHSQQHVTTAGTTV